MVLHCAVKTQTIGYTLGLHHALCVPLATLVSDLPFLETSRPGGENHNAHLMISEMKGKEKERIWGICHLG